MDSIFNAFTTCGEACWYAREDVCRCSCHGKNHGILRTANGLKPERTKHAHGKLYKLIAVTDYNHAYFMRRDDYGNWLDKVGYDSGQSYPDERIIFNKATLNQLNWIEVSNVQQDTNLEKYLVWERTDSPKTW